MDNITLGGPQDAVARDVQTVMDAGHDVGVLNVSKCELISQFAMWYCDSSHTSVICADTSAMQNFRVLHLFWCCSRHSMVTTL